MKNKNYKVMNGDNKAHHFIQTPTWLLRKTMQQQKSAQDNRNEGIFHNNYYIPLLANTPLGY